MIRCTLSRYFVVVLLVAGGSAPLHAQLLDRANRRVISGNSTLSRRWGSWNGLTAKTDALLGGGRFHAEGQFPGVMAADFVFTADVQIAEETTPMRLGTEAHLQFRISNEGRYGLAIRSTGVYLYKQVRRRNLVIDDPHVLPDEVIRQADLLSFDKLKEQAMTLPINAPHRVQVIASGPSLSVSVDGVPLPVYTDSALGVGRFGLYATGATNASSAIFTRVTADAMVTASSNFALLYNTLGYEAAGPKRALVRTVSPLPPEWVKTATFYVIPASGRGRPAAQGSLTFAKSLGMATWAADFDGVTTAGSYLLVVRMLGRDAALSGRFFDHTLVSSPFEVGTNLITTRMLRPMALANPEARRAADDDMSWYWDQKSGRFIVQDDGSIYAEGDAGFGGLLERKFDGYGLVPPMAATFTLSGDIAIDSGCDAQLQFQVKPDERFAVTLQAGSAGGCVRGGPGAVSLHYESIDPRSYSERARAILPKPFELKRFYSIVVNVYAAAGGNYADVDVDGVRTFTHIKVGDWAGIFAIKSWSSTARFDHVIAWSPGLNFVMRAGVRIPVLPHDGKVLTCEEGTEAFTDPQSHQICYPLFAQRHGFHDCNNRAGEGTSHGTFLAGLMDVWTRRREMLGPNDVISLHRAVTAAARYLDELQRTAGYTGEYAHEEPSRGARTGASWYYQVWYGLYGDAALAAKGADLDPVLARDACVRVARTVTWLDAEPGRVATRTTRFKLAEGVPAWSDDLKALVYAQLAQCASREGAVVLLPMPVERFSEEATNAAHRWMEYLANNVASVDRQSNRGIPWLSGVDEVLRFGDDPYLTDRLHMLEWKLRHIDPEGFAILPQGTTEQWNDRTVVPANGGPLVPLPNTNPALTWYGIAHFATSAIDEAILIHYADREDRTKEDSKRRAAGSLGWILGLNPGIPATKALNPSPGGRPWTAAAFVRNMKIPSARGMDAYLTKDTIRKYWLYDWEEDVRSVHRETWYIQPKNNNFVTLVNGHLLWDGEWDYWNQGANGWMSGETFLLHDGAFLRGAIAFEDAIAGRWPPQHAPLPPRSWDTTNVTVFDTTLSQRKQTGWGFEYINDVSFAHASRMSQELCDHLGYAGGRPTVHQIGERIGVVCVPHVGTRAFDIDQLAINRAGSQSTDINTVPWDEASRTAAALCGASPGGFFTGHQIGEVRGVICPGTNSAKRFTTTNVINTPTWQDASRAATDFCLTKNYWGGFFDGNQAGNERGVVCLRAGG